MLVKSKNKVQNKKMELRDGMYARGDITTERKKDVLVIPRDSLIPEENVSDYGDVFVVVNGKAERRRVRIGDNRQDRIWVRDGLQEGEWVVLERGPSLRDGTEVRIVSDAVDSGS